MEIHQKLKFWFKQEGRDLPWRHTKDPYLIWLSEVILQQTRVEQGMPYYWKFSERFPSIHDLANASDDEVFRLWQGLGYYSRAKSLLKTARAIQTQFGGVFPDNYDDLLLLPGIGPYTAAAVASFAFNKPHPVLDGNVKRVVSRCLKIEAPIEQKKVETDMYAWLYEHIDKTDAGIFNQSIMELGALICLPRKPSCLQCPIQEHCLASREKNPERYPIKKPKPKKQTIYLAFAHAQNKGKWAIQKRQAKGIWANLWELPSVITKETPTIADVVSLFPGIENHRYFYLDLAPHLLSHREIRARVFVFEYEGLLSDGTTWIDLNDLEDYGFPRILTRYFESGTWKIKD
jgi:A/G-specific adenine glycosylase